MKIPSIKSKHYKSNIPRADTLFTVLVILLSVFGTLMVFSAGYAYAEFRYSDRAYFVKKQIVWLAVGIAVMLIASRVKSEVYYTLTPALYVFTLFLLLLVLIVGFVGNGAKRWISIGPITIQPSEIAKLTMLMMLSKYFADNPDVVNERRSNKVIFFKGTLIPAIIMAVPIIFVMLQKHLSCIIILGIIGLLLITLSGVAVRYLAAFMGIGALFVSYIAFFTDYTKARITVWQNPEAYKLTGGWQTLQGLMAIGSGGIFGKGYGQSILKYCYVSEPANDMIFAILCEELGFVGAVSVILLFALLIGRGIFIGLGANNTYDRLLALGISVKMATQVLLNISVVTNTIPNTGISLPFFSYGGSSLVMLFFEMGIMLSISISSRIKK